jgi:serine/threonine protein phosphatase PrpC
VSRPTTRFVHNVAAFTSTGGKSYNEDRFVIGEVDNWTLVAVMGMLVFLDFFRDSDACSTDGHGGSFAVEHVSRNLLSLTRDLMHQYQSPPLIFNELFCQLQDSLSASVSNSSNPRAISCGTTATVCLYNDQVLHMGHTGDSRGVLCHRGQLELLTTDHRPDNSAEQQRITAAGGKISYRGGTPRVNGDLSMTRALGAFHLQDAGLIYEPELLSRELEKDDDSFLMLATDGLFEVLQDHEIVALAQQAATPSQAAEAIGDLALAYGAVDNVTLVLVPLAGWPRLKDASLKVPFSNRNLIRRTS